MLCLLLNWLYRCLSFAMFFTAHLLLLFTENWKFERDYLCKSEHNTFLPDMELSSRFQFLNSVSVFLFQSMVESIKHCIVLLQIAKVRTTSAQFDSSVCRLTCHLTVAIVLVRLCQCVHNMCYLCIWVVPCFQWFSGSIVDKGVALYSFHHMFHLAF